MGGKAQRGRHGVQFGQQLLRSGGAFLGVFRHHPPDQCRQRGGDPGILHRRVGGGVPLVLQQFLQHGPLGERWFRREHVVQRAAQRVDVAPHIGQSRVAGLLGRDIVERSQRRPGRGQVGLALVAGRHASQPQVDQLRLPLGGQHDVRRLDVAVHHLPGCHVGQGPRQLSGVIHHGHRVELPPGDEAVAHVAPGDVFEGDVEQPLVFPHVVNPRDVRVIELSGELGFAPEPFGDGGVA